MEDVLIQKTTVAVGPVPEYKTETEESVTVPEYKLQDEKELELSGIVKYYET